MTAETSRFSGIGHCGSRTARRVSGLTRHGTGGTSGQCSFFRSCRDASDRPRPSDGADVPIPGPEQRFAESLPLAFGRDHRVGAPRRLDLDAAERQPHRHRRVVTDDGRAFARDPDQRRAVRVVRVAAILPVPSQTTRRGGVGAEDAPVERFDPALIVRPVPIDF